MKNFNVLFRFSFFVLALFFCFSLFAQDIERVVIHIKNGKFINDRVTIYGFCDRWELKPGTQTYFYMLRDDWGDEVKVLTDKGQPKTNTRYKIIGLVGVDPINGEHIVNELERVELTETPPAPQPSTPPITYPPSMPVKSEVPWTLITLVGLTAVVLIALIFVLVSMRKPAVPDIFKSGDVVLTEDKTVKVSAAKATDKAIAQGTVKVMPGRFEVVGGVDLKELRLIRPSGIPEHSIAYTFGRKEGAPITHIRLNDSTVSSNQAKLTFKAGKYTLINFPDPDDPDRNATQINGKPMQANETYQLKDGDEITMGVVKLIFREK